MVSTVVLDFGPLIPVRDGELSGSVQGGLSLAFLIPVDGGELHPSLGVTCRPFCRSLDPGACPVSFLSRMEGAPL